MGRQSDDPCVRLGTAGTRLRTGLQCLKQSVLGEAHDPQRPQLELLLQTLREYDVNLEGRLSLGTLENWWTGTVQRANRQTCCVLDELAAELLVFPRSVDGELVALEPDFFTALMRGGSLRSLWASGTRTGFREGGLARFISYLPVSNFHLHFDALEGYWCSRCQYIQPNRVRSSCMHILHAFSG